MAQKGNHLCYPEETITFKLENKEENLVLEGKQGSRFNYSFS